MVLSYRSGLIEHERIIESLNQLLKLIVFSYLI